MKAQFNNYLLGSAILWLDNVLTNEGEAKYNVSTKFYPVNKAYAGVYCYASPYKQLGYDNTISGANVLTGIYLNNTFIGTGTSGFLGINMEEGLAMFSSQVPNGVVVSGSGYTVKEINVKSISEPQERILYTNAYYNKNRPLSVSGNLTNEQPLPAIYVRLDNAVNEEYSFGGEESSNRNIVLTLLATSEYDLDAMVSLIVDKTRSYIPIFTVDEMPLDNYKRLKNPNFSYSGVACTKINAAQAAFINEIQVYSFNSQVMSELRQINESLYPAIIELTTQMIRYPRHQ